MEIIIRIFFMNKDNNNNRIFPNIDIKSPNNEKKDAKDKCNKDSYEESYM